MGRAKSVRINVMGTDKTLPVFIWHILCRGISFLTQGTAGTGENGARLLRRLATEKRKAACSPEGTAGAGVWQQWDNSLGGSEDKVCRTWKTHNTLRWIQSLKAG